MNLGVSSIYFTKRSSFLCVVSCFGQLLRHGSFGVGGETPKRRLGHLVATIRVNGVHVFE